MFRGETRSARDRVALAMRRRDDVAGITGFSFSLGGLAAVVGLLVVGQRVVRPGRLRWTLIAGAVLTALAHYLLALADRAMLFVAFFALLSLVQATLIPATNTLIATNVSRSRRGTGFGVASSAQALAMMVGPVAAAALATHRFEFAFGAVGTLFLALVALVFLAVREPGSGATD